MLKGSIVALITPMNRDGSVDNASLERLVEFHINQGTDAIVAVGTTGESSTLTQSEHIAVVEQVLSFAAGRIPVIAGNGANATAHGVELTQKLANTGVAAMLGVTPYYNKPSPKGIVAHYRAIANSTDIPQILYNVPGRTCLDMQPEVIAELANVSNIIGVKEATGDVTRVATLRSLCGDDFLLFSGDDASAKDFMLLGGDGVISVANNIVPKTFKAMCDAALSGNAELAKIHDDTLRGLYGSLFCEANPIPVKWASHQLGLISNAYIRLPLTELSEQFHGLLLETMKQAQLKV